MKKILIIILLLTLICIPSQVTSGQADSSNKYAVIIGTDNKPCAPVHGSNCAKLLQRILIDEGFPQKNIKILLNQRASPDAVYIALLWLQQAPADSEVVFAFFGHGSSQTILVYKWYLWHETIRDWLAPIQSQKQLIIIDSCGSAGAILEGRDGITLCAPNRIVVTSTSSEIESSVLNGRYTDWTICFLINCIQGRMNDLNGDGRVSIQEAASAKGLICDNYGEEFFL